jgi:hypothetical protein
VTSRRLVGFALVVAAVVGVIGCAGGGPHAARTSGEASPGLRYVIPAGTSAEIEAGRHIDLLPAELRARVGDVIQIVNRDDRGQVIGPFYVAARSTMTQRFTAPGTFVGRCTVHVSGQIRLTVRDRT